MNRFIPLNILLITAIATTLPSCRDEIYISTSTSVPADEGRITGVDGFYLINEGNMGSNRASIDYMDETTGTYTRNIYAERNPSVVKELGDVGNDITIYGSRLYAVINCSHKVEVMHSRDARRIGQIDIPNCRYVIGHGSYIYISSYVSPVQLDPKAPRGAVFKIDTLSLKITDRIDVGYQPEEMAVSNGKLYVANSGGYRVPDYDRTVTVIDLENFVAIKEIDVAINLHRVRTDRNGMVYVSSRGNLADIPSRLYVIDPKLDRVTHEIDCPVSDMWIHGDSLYSFAAIKNEITGSTAISYAMVNLQTGAVTDNSLIKDGTEREIKMPYGIAVHPVTKEFYITDARNYVSSGRIHCYSPEGVRRWTQTTGDIPARITFLTH